MDFHTESHKLHEKKKKLREKNRRDWIIFQHAELALKKTTEDHKPRHDKKPGKQASAETKPWSAKLSTIRNRLDNSRRESEDRWNRFAGTTDGGGRGR